MNYMRDRYTIRVVMHVWRVACQSYEEVRVYGESLYWVAYG